MEWPWVSRSRLDSQERYIRRLEQELIYYREKFEREQERADRAVDSVVEFSGREPLSAPVRQERVERKDAAQRMLDQTSEMFGDVVESVVGSAEESTEPEKSAMNEAASEYPEELKVPERLQTLAQIYTAIHSGQ